MKTKTNYSVACLLIAILSFLTFSCTEQSLEEDSSTNETIMSYEGGGDDNYGGGGAPY